MNFKSAFISQSVSEILDMIDSINYCLKNQMIKLGNKEQRGKIAYSQEYWLRSSLKKKG